MLRGKFKLEVEVTRAVACFDCDHLKESIRLVEGKKRFGFFRTLKRVWVYRCSKLGIELDYEKHISLGSDSLPCDAKFWQTTSDFDVLDHDETVHFEDVELLPAKKETTT